jgi:hypothetical protein
MSTSRPKEFLKAASSFWKKVSRAGRIKRCSFKESDIKISRDTVESFETSRL